MVLRRRGAPPAATHPVVVLQEADAPFRELRIPVVGLRASHQHRGEGARDPEAAHARTVRSCPREFGMTLDVVRITEVRGSALPPRCYLRRSGMRVDRLPAFGAIALALRHTRRCPIVAATHIVFAGRRHDPMGAN